MLLYVEKPLLYVTYLLETIKEGHHGLVKPTEEQV